MLCVIFLPRNNASRNNKVLLRFISTRSWTWILLSKTTFLFIEFNTLCMIIEILISARSRWIIGFKETIFGAWEYSFRTSSKLLFRRISSWSWCLLLFVLMDSFSNTECWGIGNWTLEYLTKLVCYIIDEIDDYTLKSWYYYIKFK